MRAPTVVKAVCWLSASALVALSLFLLLLVFPATPNGGRSLSFKGFVHLPSDGRTGVLSILDYLTASNGNLFVTNSSTGTVYRIPLQGGVVPAASAIAMFALAPAAHGVAIDPVGRLAYVTRSEANTVDMFDPSTMRLVKRLHVADDPDGIFYVSSVRMIYVANGDAKSATLIDPASRRIEATISLGGKPEYGAFDDKTRLLYQNLEDTGAVAGVDLAKRTVAKRWSLSSCESPTGMAIDEPGRQLFIGCSGNAMLVVFSLVAHRVIASIPLRGGPDSVAYDATLQRIYVTGRAGELSVIGHAGGGFAVLDTISLHYGAHTLAVDPLSHRLYAGYASLLIAPRLAVFAPKQIAD